MKVSRLTKISPTADRDLGQGGHMNAFSRLSEIIFSYVACAKTYYVIILYTNCIIILFTKNVKQLIFALMLVKKNKSFMLSLGI